MKKKVYGHKTCANGEGGYRYTPIHQVEAKRLWKEAEVSEAARARAMPDDKAALKALFTAWQRLKELGWSEAVYCPKDGTLFDAIEAGSTGIHRCYYEGEWPNGHWWVESEGDLYPSRPILYRALKA